MTRVCFCKPTGICNCSALGVLLGCQLGARWCLASSLTCDFNMIKNYTHDWLLLVAAYHASPLGYLARLEQAAFHVQCAPPHMLPVRTLCVLPAPR